MGRVFSLQGSDYGLGPRWKDPGEEYNFVGVYRTFFNTDGPDAPEKRYVLSFLGIASCADVYMNGHYVGYTKGSHNTAEFDVTPYLHDWLNEVVVVVRRWCNGSYLEDQDMFRNNGIFRDVLLRISEPTDIRDIDAVTKKTGGSYSLTLSASLYSDTPVTFTLEGHGLSERRVASALNGQNGYYASVTFENLKVKEWNAEEPTLYNIYYETASACIKERIGFKTVEIQGDVFLVNGRKIKFHGVNHHDSSPTNGYTLTPDEIERDLQLCKDFNMTPSEPRIIRLILSFWNWRMKWAFTLWMKMILKPTVPLPISCLLPTTPSAMTKNGRSIILTVLPGFMSGIRFMPIRPSSCGPSAMRPAVTTTRMRCMTG